MPPVSFLIASSFKKETATRGRERERERERKREREREKEKERERERERGREMGQLTTPLVAENRALKTDSFFLRPFRFDANNFDVGVNVDNNVNDDDDANNNEFNRKARRVELEQQKK